ncbi:unnamed protein product, partial [Didymodactylos carnosus]
GIISSQSEDIVHHMELYHCNVPTNHEIPKYNKWWTTERKPMDLMKCHRVIGAWTFGTANFSYSPETGEIIDGKNYLKYVV